MKQLGVLVAWQGKEKMQQTLQSAPHLKVAQENKDVSIPQKLLEQF